MGVKLILMSVVISVLIERCVVMTTVFINICFVENTFELIHSFVRRVVNIVIVCDLN